MDRIAQLLEQHAEIDMPGQRLLIAARFDPAERFPTPTVEHPEASPYDKFGGIR